mmetsp:Transcript_16422/g.34240  ORF Transcript_16422/g.34240 Transcript_16422/m.34240 type:complete len:466 (+) Transcript_16422:253-1650(+)|eukprot:CAMPEP_0168185908 /NCGR_PEP_ID=MMETSP0139_2-20121125/14116_1 /TAXON_ID=44445 /ORGANISM="Pseudo-nitzschia australis, Strain 10249 10 AB" /LENGTH=465 /DNA_ID=CAMNT_0008107813 /DNA_START=209 /DNA_END=1606 /DNA_ORIENTATION=-
MARDSYQSSSLEHGSSKDPCLGFILSLVMFGAIAGAAITLRISAAATAATTTDAEDDDEYQNETEGNSRCLCHAVTQRERLPLLVILVRHGESEGNVDRTAWWRKADHEIELTEKGRQQATDAGKRIESIFLACDDNYDTGNLVGKPSINDQENNNTNKTKINTAHALGKKRRRRPAIRHVHLHVSPFDRTIQTARYARSFFGHRVTDYKLCPRLREQELGNLQGEAFSGYRQEQKKVGRFWYRFPTGESGADVLDRVKSWWINTLIQTNNIHRCNPDDDNDCDDWANTDHYCDAVVVFSHGLTIRSILCQLFKWSIYTYHSVYNAKNCDLYVLRRDLTKPGRSPYVLDGVYGDLPKSSIDVCVTFSRTKLKRNDFSSSDNNNNEKGDKERCSNKKEKEPIEGGKIYKVRDYLSVPAPRMSHIGEIKSKLVEQYPEDFVGGSEDIESISFLPFCSGHSPQVPSRG